MDSFQKPAHVPESEYPVRRLVALAYRAQRQAGRPHRVAIDAAEAAYLAVHPEGATDRLAMSGHVMQMIASAVHVDPAWFWRGVGR
jgi:hypothetical protein